MEAFEVEEFNIKQNIKLKSNQQMFQEKRSDEEEEDDTRMMDNSNDSSKEYNSIDHDSSIIIDLN